MQQLIQQLPETHIGKLLDLYLEKVNVDLCKLYPLDKKGAVKDKQNSDTLQACILVHDIYDIILWLKKNSPSKTMMISCVETKPSVLWCKKVFSHENYETIYQELEKYYGDSFNKTVLFKLKTENDKLEALSEYLGLDEATFEGVCDLINALESKETVVDIIISKNKIDLGKKVIEMYGKDLKLTNSTLTKYTKENKPDIEFMALITNNL